MNADQINMNAIGSEITPCNFESTILASIEQAKRMLHHSPISLAGNLREKLGFVRGVCFAKGWNLQNLINCLEDELNTARANAR